MSKPEIYEFCDKYDACCAGRKWALETCSSMHGVWEQLRCEALSDGVKAEWLLWLAARALPSEKLKRFNLFCALQLRVFLPQSFLELLDRCGLNYCREEAEALYAELPFGLPAVVRSAACHLMTTVFRDNCTFLHCSVCSLFRGHISLASADAVTRDQMYFVRMFDNPFEMTEVKDDVQCLYG